MQAVERLPFETHGETAWNDKLWIRTRKKTRHDDFNWIEQRVWAHEKWSISLLGKWWCVACTWTNSIQWINRIHLNWICKLIITLLAAHGMSFIERNWTFFPFSANGMSNWLNFITKLKVRDMADGRGLCMSLSLIVCVCYFHRPLNMRDVEHNQNTNPSQQARTWFSRRHKSI